MPIPRRLATLILGLALIPGVGPASAAAWSPFLLGGYGHHFGTDIDGGGDFSTDRVLAQAGVTRELSGGGALTLAVDYGRYRYHFSGDTGFGGLRPWRGVRSLGLGAALRRPLNARWDLLAVPGIRFATQDGADAGDAVSGGGYLAFPYRFSDRLTLGPGLGVYQHVEDDPVVFPLLVVNWRITDRLSLDTGGTLGATLGPGVSLNWRPRDAWRLFVGARFDLLRFRLDRDSAVPEGIGQDSAVALVAGAMYGVTPRVQVGIVAGTALAGRLRLEDADGRGLVEEDYDPRGFAGAVLSARF